MKQVGIYGALNLDDAYLEEWKRQEQEYKANILNLLEKYLKDARGLVIEEELDNWDKCILPRLNDIYRGIELGYTLDIIRIMRDESVSLDERLVKAQQEFYSQGHSGGAISLMFAMLCKFCPDGDVLVEYLRK